MTTRRSLLFNLKLRAMQAREAGLEMLWVEVSEVEMLVNPELCHFTVDSTPDGTGRIVGLCEDTQKRPITILRSEQFKSTVDDNADTLPDFPSVYDGIDVGD